ncbi:MAG: HPr(Ser) kinase/phosphatase [Eubacteriales bacterium]|nr:HPr(Ser) kinase/phosphatase [Eubacteriales bacterium]
MGSIALKTILEALDLKVLINEEEVLARWVTVPDVTRPGLQLAGNFEHFGPDRIQIIGNMERAYLAKLPEAERAHKLAALFATGIPCLILSRGHEADQTMLRLAREFKVPIIVSEESTGNLISALVEFLRHELAAKISLHGVLVEVYGEGILILGESGVGKSETALEIVKRGHRLIADDMVEVRRVSDTTLIGRAPKMIRHLIEIRGLGILDVKELYGVSSVKPEENIHFVINLENWDESKVYDRTGLLEESTDILGIDVPSITIPVRPGRNLAVIVEVAAINFRQKSMGYNAAEALDSRVRSKIERAKYSHPGQDYNNFPGYGRYDLGDPAGS